MNKTTFTLIILLLHLSSQAQSDSTFDTQGILYKVSYPSEAHVIYFDTKGKPIRNGSIPSDISPDLKTKITRVLAETDFSNYFKTQNTDTLKLTLSVTTGITPTPTIRITGDPIPAGYDTLIKARVKKAIQKQKFPRKQVSIYEINFFSIRMSPIRREKRSPGYKMD